MLQKLQNEVELMKKNFFFIWDPFTGSPWGHFSCRAPGKGLSDKNIRI